MLLPHSDLQLYFNNNNKTELLFEIVRVVLFFLYVLYVRCDWELKRLLSLNFNNLLILNVLIAVIVIVSNNIIDLANRKTTKETNESKSNW